MRLYSPQFAKSLRRAIRARIRATPAFKREYRRAGRRHIGSQRVRWGAPLLFSFILFSFVGATAAGHPAAALAIIGIVAFFVVVLREQALLRDLYRSPDLHALSLLPLTAPEIFRWQIGRFFRESLYTFFMLLGGFLGLAFYPGFTLWQTLALIPIAALTWATTIALALFSAVHLRRQPFLVIRGYLIFGMVFIVPGSFIAIKMLGIQVVLPVVDRCAPWLLILLPTAWPVSLARLLLPGAGWADVLLLVPTLVIIWTTRDSIRTLLSKYRFQEVTRPIAPDLVPSQWSVPPTNTLNDPNTADPSAALPADIAPDAPTPARLGVTAITEIIQSRAFLAPPQWPGRGWFEKMFWRWLTPRERGLSQIIFPDGLRLTAPWKKTFWIAAVAVLSGFAAGAVMPNARYWIHDFGIFLALCYALNLTLASGRPFQFHATGGVLLPAYAYFPMGLREISRILLKLSAVQFPALLALCVVCAPLVLDQFDLPRATVLIDGVQYGIRAAVVFFALRFVLLVFQFSNTSNDTQRLRPFTVPLVILMVAFVLAFIPLAVIGVFVNIGLLGWAAAIVAVLEAGLFLLVYSWFYRRNFFDLTRLPRR